MSSSPGARDRDLLLKEPSLRAGSLNELVERDGDSEGVLNGVWNLVRSGFLSRERFKLILFYVDFASRSVMLRAVMQ